MVDISFFLSIFALKLTTKLIIGMKTLLFFGLGGQEVLIIALVVLLLFGGAKIPELMRGMGKGVKSFKDGMKGIDDEVNTDEK